MNVLYGWICCHTDILTEYIIQKSWDAFHDSALYLSRSLVQGSHSIAGPTFSCRRCAWHRARASKANSYLHNILVLHVFNCKPMTNTFIGHSLMLTLVCLFVKKLCPSLNFLFRAHNHMDSHMLNWALDIEKLPSLPLLTPLWRQHSLFKSLRLTAALGWA